jgi:tRNA modification GTPase
MAVSEISSSLEIDTIVAIATPPGRGGIGIVRLSGPESGRIALALVVADHMPEAGRARLVSVLDRSKEGAPIDQAVLTVFRAPHSYTGEDVAEIAAHGSPVVLETLLEGAIKAGARLANPGEYTQRAFLNGRIDLTQAEAVQDLIAAQTLEQARMAAQQLGGALSRRVAPIKERLLYLIALLEAGMDFASGELDDVDVVAPEQIEAVIRQVLSPLETLAASYARGHRLREGASLALVGRPNVGKSSLFNALLERERAIVTAAPGTTRDTVEETVAIGGIPVQLVDTAGLRIASDAPLDEAEEMGIVRSKEAIADADLVLVVLDSTQAVRPEERALVASLEDRPHLIVGSKVDLLVSSDPEAVGLQRDGVGALLTSARKGEGLEALRAAILQQLLGAGSPAAEGALNSLRQRQAVDEARDALNAAAQANQVGLPHELLLVDLHRALRALDGLTGTTTTDDILGRIFSTFCIGK